MKGGYMTPEEYAELVKASKQFNDIDGTIAEKMDKSTKHDYIKPTAPVVMQQPVQQPVQKAAPVAQQAQPAQPRRAPRRPQQRPAQTVGTA